MKKTFKILSAVTALTMLCTATAPVFTTAADPAPATAVVDEDTSLCGYMVKMQDGAAATAEALGGNCTVYGYETWSEWYPTVSGEIMGYIQVSYSTERPWLTEQKKETVNVTCDESYYFVRPEALEEEDVILSCRSLVCSHTIPVAVAYPLYLDVQTQTPYIESSYENAGQIRHQENPLNIEEGLILEDAPLMLRYYAQKLLLPDQDPVEGYFNKRTGTSTFDFSLIKADVNGDRIIDATDAMLTLHAYAIALIGTQSSPIMLEDLF